MINYIKNKWKRFLHPVQVGDVWEQLVKNPFQYGLKFEVIETMGNWARVKNLKDGDIFEWDFKTIRFYMKLEETSTYYKLYKENK